MLWAKCGDKNTRFFHMMASSRQSRNFLDSVVVDGVRVVEPNSMKLAVHRHFMKLFSESWSSRPKLLGPFVSVSSPGQVETLEAEFSEQEIWAAVKDCDGNKAPGPDGFSLACIQKCWHIMKGEVLHFMEEFHSNGKIVSGLNSSFITLIPKRVDPCELSDYRPISLVNSVYKILAKVLSKRLKSVLLGIISEVQTAFLGGRSILDGVLIANEVVHWWKAAKMRGIILKLDFEKAYDSVNWEFLLSMMKNFGFGEKWMGWIKSCLSSSRVSVLVNGSPTTEFTPQRGLRQGDPLSPLLFNIVAEGLNILIERAKELGLVKGASVGPSELKFSHLQFADDSIIFCEADRSELKHIKRILRCFEVGFDERGGTDEFSTEELEERLAKAQVIIFDGESSRNQSKSSAKMRSVWQSTNSNSSDSE